MKGIETFMKNKKIICFLKIFVFIKYKKIEIILKRTMIFVFKII